MPSPAQKEQEKPKEGNDAQHDSSLINLQLTEPDDVDNDEDKDEDDDKPIVGVTANRGPRLNKTSHLVLGLGNPLINAYSNSAFAVTCARELALSPRGALTCASSSATHSCEKRLYPRLDVEEDAAKLADLYDELPNVTKLEVLCAEIDLEDESIEGGLSGAVLALVEHWADTLVTLKIWFQYAPDNYGALLGAINASLTSLRHLTLEVVDLSPDETLPPPFELPILGQLEEFFYCYPTLLDALLEQLHKHAESNGNLVKVGLRSERGISQTSHTFGKLLLLDAGLCARFVHLPELHRPFDPAQAHALFLRFHSLTSLDIDAATLSLVTLAKCLAPLTQLIHLHLTNAFSRLPTTLAATDDAVPRDKIDQLPSVRGLTVELFAPSHTALQCVHWGWVFSAVAEVRVNNRRTLCSICDRASLLGLSKADPSAKVKCTRQLLEPLRQCTSLTVTYPVNILTEEKSPVLEKSPTSSSPTATKSGPVAKQQQESNKEQQKVHNK